MKIANLFLMFGMFVGGMYTQTVGGLTQAQKDVLNTLEVVYLDDCVGGPGYKTLRVKNANLQVVNGTNDTTISNGLGNVIIGYNEDQSTECEIGRAGSHNLILGKDQEYTSVYGNIISGYSNICTGSNNIVHGQDNIIHTTSDLSVVLAGDNHFMNDIFSAMIAGNNNRIDSDHAAIIGGELNLTTGQGAVVTGGDSNLASGSYSTVSGGNGRTASGINDWVAGSLFEDN